MFLPHHSWFSTTPTEMNLRKLHSFLNTSNYTCLFYLTAYLFKVLTFQKIKAPEMLAIYMYRIVAFQNRLPPMISYTIKRPSEQILT